MITRLHCFGQNDVCAQGRQAHHAERVRHPDQRNQGQRYQPSAIPEAQISRQRKEAQAQRDVVVHESHLERPAVGENRDEWGKLPGRAARGRGDQSKRAPEKRQYGERYGDLFGNPQAEGRPQPAQKKIVKNVVPLARDP